MQDIRHLWKMLPVKIDDNDLRIGDEHVMQAWERPLMEAMARGVTKHRGDVLEIGYGMGISAEAIIRCGCRSYTVIEAHPEIAARARSFGLKVLEGFWEDLVPDLTGESFDGIFFDTYPLDDSYFKNAITFQSMVRLLRPGGVFTYFTGQTKEIPYDDMELLLRLYGKVEVLSIGGLSPPKDCRYSCGETMIVVFATK